jgi:DNA invertase Pin-like site-specific DNA recombinase
MPNYFYAYGRASTARQVLGVEAQEQKLRAYYDTQDFKEQGIEWGGFTSDRATSGKVRFVERENGEKLHELLQDGDHIGFAKADRAFRKLSDMAFCCEIWKEKGVRVHVLDWHIDTRSAVGSLILGILSCVAEFERCRIAERTQEALAVKRSKGQMWTRTPRYGFRVMKIGGVCRSVPDPEERRVMAWIVKEYLLGASWSDMYLHLAENRIRTRKGNEWSQKRIRRACAAELALQAAELADTSRSPRSASSNGAMPSA